MSLSHLLEALERDANKEIDRLRAAARAAADGIAGESDARLGERRRLALEEVARRHRFELEQALTVARRAARHAVLDARQRLQQRVFDRVRAVLPDALGTPPYQTSLPAALEQALAALGEGPVAIRCTPALGPVIAAVTRTAGATVVPDATAGSGFVMQGTDASVEVVDTLEERLERRRPELTRWMFERLEADA